MRKSTVVLVVLSCLLLTACTTPYQSELKEARANCPDSTKTGDIPRRGELKKLVDCVTQQQRSVVAKYDPYNINLFDATRAQIAILAENYDNGKISYATYGAQKQQITASTANIYRSRQAADDTIQHEQISDALHSLSGGLQNYSDSRSQSAQDYQQQQSQFNLQMQQERQEEQQQRQIQDLQNQLDQQKQDAQRQQKIPSFNPPVYGESNGKYGYGN